MDPEKFNIDNITAAKPGNTHARNQIMTNFPND
jgi:hypothetical protein